MATRAKRVWEFKQEDDNSLAFLGKVMERSSAPTADQFLKSASELVHGRGTMTPSNDQENLSRLEIAFNGVFVWERPDVTVQLYWLLKAFIGKGVLVNLVQKAVVLLGRELYLHPINISNKATRFNWGKNGGLVLFY